MAHFTRKSAKVSGIPMGPMPDYIVEHVLGSPRFQFRLPLGRQEHWEVGYRRRDCRGV